ncbi:unnamed protein product [Symbiodinium natans]|uniref:BRCT domain-containing protein n=1 Tax=Symbiodinium natans TaxID=878477 RepID=A0A812I738_9DINO|nr:unnamed protein product [Symbiodinium natans]
MLAHPIQRLHVPAARFAAAGSLFRIRGKGPASTVASTKSGAQSPAAPFTPHGRAAVPGLQSQATEATFNLASGQHRMRVGKYKGKTFAEIYAEDPQYCKWACDIALTGENTNDSLKVFAAFVQHRWLLAVRDLCRQARPNSLRSQRLAVTGQPDEITRELLEGFIRILGGEVVSQVSPGSKPPATGVVVAGSTLYGGKPVQESSKLEKAAAAGVPVMTMEDLRRLATQVPANESKS